MNIVVDIETDSLDATKIYCIVARNMESGDNYAFVGDDCYDKFPKFIEKHAEKIVMHNGVGFDAPVLNRLARTNIRLPQIEDTLIMSQLYNPERMNGHSLDSWGKRLGYNKIEFHDFSKFTNEMLTYCKRDVELTHKVYNHLKLEGKNFSDYSLRLEHDIRSIVSKQEKNGFYLDQQKAMELRAKLEDQAEDIEKNVHKTFPPLKREEEFVPKVNNKTRGYEKGVPFTKVSYEKFNLASRKQIAERLMMLGWKPNKFTDKNSPIVDEGVLSKITNIPEAKLIAKYLLLKKRTSQISSWLDEVSNTTGRVHGRVLTLRCVSGRMSHNSPNMAQVPATYSPFGKECREVWTTDKPDTHVIFGTDASGLELRMLAHYIDTPDYTNEILNGDIHTKNMNMAGLTDRDQAKTFIYAFLFGAGAKKISTIVGSKDLTLGKKLIDKFLSELPRLKSFRSQVEEAAQSGKVRGLDGRLFNVRSAHKAVNTIIQGAGAIACKVWLRNMMKHVYKKGLDVKLIASIHDEYQFEVNKNDIQSMGEVVKLSIKETTEQLNLKCPLDAEFKTGSSWADTH
jgi:DNA polymerase-1